MDQMNDTGRYKQAFSNGMALAIKIKIMFDKQINE